MLLELTEICVLPKAGKLLGLSLDCWQQHATVASVPAFNIMFW